MTKKISDLTPNPRNPRRATQEKLDAFEGSLGEFGPLHGVVFNRETGLLVGGHMTGKVLGPEAEIKVDQNFDPPTATGTVAYGWILLDGERIPYREVMFEPLKEAAAMVAANRGAGQFDWGKLTEIFLDLDANNFDLSLTLFDDAERENIIVGQGQSDGGGGTSDSGEDKPAGSLSEKFMIPPFSVFNAREGWWQDRKRYWIAMGIKSEEGRGGGA